MSENKLYRKIKEEMKQNEDTFTIVFEQTLKCIALIDRITGNKSNLELKQFENRENIYKNEIRNLKE